MNERDAADRPFLPGSPPASGDELADELVHTRMEGQASGGPAETDLLFQLRLDQRQRWQQGERVRVEDYLDARPSLRNADDTVLDLLFREVQLREERGEFPEAEELVQRFPSLEAAIRQQFRLHLALHSRPGPAAPVGANTEGAGALPTDDPASTRPLDAASLPKRGEWLAIPGYEVLSELGRGGMGVVYKARHRKLNRLVALKMVLSGVHAGTTELARFRHEAEAVARVQHPNLVQIYEVGEHEGRAYFALEYVDGGSLEKLLDGKPQTPRRAAELVETLARAVYAVHQCGLVHRDLKPANVLLSAAGVPKITDFGLAREMSGGAGRTATGDILGTPLYMAPEQATGRIKDVGAHTDIWALGAILYELLTGRPPFLADSSIEILHQVAEDEPLPPTRLHRKLPRDLETICLKCLEKDPRKRYASALELAEDCAAYLREEPIRARPVGRLHRLVKWARRRPALAGLLVVSALAGFALLAGGLVYHMRLQQAFQEAHDRSEETRRLLVRLNVARGSRQVDDGNWFRALIGFTEALRLDRGHAEREEMHRIRLATHLARCPTLKQLWFQDGAVHWATFDRRGERVVSAGEDGTARVWDVSSGAAVGAPSKHDDPAHYAEFSPDGRRAVSAGGHAAHVWEPGGLKAPLLLTHTHEVRIARFSPDGLRIVTGGAGPAALLWDATTGRRLPISFPHTAAVRWLAFSPNGRRLVTASADGTARVWDPMTGRAVTPPLKHKAPLTHAAFSPDGQLVLTASEDHTARLWSVAEGTAVLPPFRHGRTVQHGDFSGDGKWLVTAGDDRTARVRNAITGEPRMAALKHTSDVNRAWFSPDGKWVVTAGDDNSARLWNAVTGDLLPPWLPHNGSVLGATFSPDGRHVLTFSSDTMVRLWDLAPVMARAVCGDSGKHAVPATPPAGNGPKAVSADGRLVVRAEKGNFARVEDARTGTPIGKPLQHGSFVLHVAFSPHGRRVATASDDNTARLWDAATSELLAPPLTHHGSVRYVEFSPDGRMVVTGSDDETARIWDAATGEALTPPLQHASPISRATFLADCSGVQTTTIEGETRTWLLAHEERPLDELTRLAELLAANRLGERGVLPIEPERLRTLWEALRKAPQ